MGSTVAASSFSGEVATEQTPRGELRGLRLGHSLRYAAPVVGTRDPRWISRRRHELRILHGELVARAVQLDRRCPQRWRNRNHPCPPPTTAHRETAVDSPNAGLDRMLAAYDPWGGGNHR